MTWRRRVTEFCRNLLCRKRLEQDLDEELRAFYDILTDRNMSRGLSREEALRMARLQFEAPEQVKEKVREERMGAAIETIARDLQYAWRTLRKSPAFTAVAVLTLSLGIGANTAIFSLIDAVMLRLLPVQHPEQLVLLTDPAQSGTSTDTTEHGVRSILSYPEFQQLQMRSQVFSALIAAQNDVSDVDIIPGSSSQPVKAHAQLVSGNFFQALGVKLIAGRPFNSQKDKIPGANPVAVISYGYWQRAFGGRPGILGSTVRVGQGIFQIIGIAPHGFRGILVGSEPDLWFPITMQQQVLPGRDYLTPRDTLWLQVMGRLAPGVSLKSAEAGINTTFQQILRNWAAALPTAGEQQQILNERIKLRPGARGASALRGEFSSPLILLMAMVGVVLLIACANLTNLLLARASGRQRELGVRLALGAARGRLISQLLAESLLLGAFGGVFGILLSSLVTRVLLALVSTGISDLGLEVPVNIHVLLFTAILSLLTAFVFGLAPAIRGTRLDINRTLAANTRGSIGDSGRTQTGRILGSAQVALSLVLLMGAALLVHSLHNMLVQQLGYNRDHLLMITVDPPAAGYKGPKAAAMYETVREQLQVVPGVSSATVANDALFTGDSGDHLSIEGSPVTNPEKLVSRWTEVGAGYFHTLEVPLLRGREINPSDATRRAPVCVINWSFLQRFFPDGNAIGKHITDEYPTTREAFEIIGVVADSVEHRPGEKKKEPRFYANITHPIGTVGTVTYLLRASGDPAVIALASRRALQQFNHNLAVLSVVTVNQQLARSLITERLIADLAASFGMLALLMTAIGLYGVMSYSTLRRTNEIGIRIALGASTRSVMTMVLGETLSMVAVGIAIGLPCAFAVARFISSRLYGISAGDPVSVMLALFTILGSALLAGYVPARRASRLDPMLSLRHD